MLQKTVAFIVQSDTQQRPLFTLASGTLGRNRLIQSLLLNCTIAVATVPGTSEKLNLHATDLLYCFQELVFDSRDSFGFHCQSTHAVGELTSTII